MSNDNQNSGGPPSPNANMNRRGSVTSAAFTNLFQRGNSSAQGTGVFPGPITTAAMNDQRRRLSVSTVGLAGTSPTQSSGFSRRRGSISTNSADSIDENAIDEEDGPPSGRTNPNTPFARRMSFGAQAMRNIRGGGTSPGVNDTAYNWSEQLRSRAESNVATGQRPSFAFGSGLNNSPPRSGATTGVSPHHDRAKSVSDMPAPPAQAPKPRQKPDHFQERILKGDFYMD